MKSLFLRMLLVVSTVGAFAQGHSVDLVTGTLNVNVPLLSISDGSVRVPVSLGYTSGVRVTDDDGWLGQSWRLSVENYRVFREMRGLPDDLNETSINGRKGWLNSTA